MDLPFDRTWWIEPGKIIGGRFPGSTDPLDPQKALQALLKAGVHTLINLQVPNEPGRAGKPFPDYEPMLQNLAQKLGCSVELYHFPIPDCGVPTVQQMHDIQEVLQKSVDAGGIAYVHCWGGHGRTGTAAGCWMVTHGISVDDVFDVICERRAHDQHLAAEIAPQTAAQRQFIIAWSEHATGAFSRSAIPAFASAADRRRGALLGLAVGDALGTTLEFKSPGTFQPITDIVGGGPFDLKAGEWTDDTSMALCLAESLIEKGGFDPCDQLQRYVRWMTQDYMSSTGTCFDIGNQTRAALREYQRTGGSHCGPTGEHNAGNGSLMRLAPVPIAYHCTPTEAIRYAGESSRTTHGARECVDACRYFAGLLVGAFRVEPKDKLLSSMYCPVEELWQREPLAPKIAAVAAGSFKNKQPPAIRGSGYVVDALEAALWAFATTTSFCQAVLRAVNLGDDADTTGAICGQLAGAYYGAAAIPGTWLAVLAKSDLIERLASGLETIQDGK